MRGAKHVGERDADAVGGVPVGLIRGGPVAGFDGRSSDGGANAWTPMAVEGGACWWHARMGEEHDRLQLEVA